MSTPHEKILDVVYVSTSPRLDGFEYSTTWSSLQRRVRDAGMKITNQEHREGKVYVTVAARHAGTDPYTGETTTAGQGSTFQGTRNSCPRPGMRH